ncbi:MAG: MarR family transcriptional regulator [Clostridia bacterium]|nr:MarR family transcriptional regulator [Clostridia bacterium]
MLEDAMTDHKYDALRIDHQLCFPLYACSREVIKQYKPLLDELDLTYTQYLTMMVLWERNDMTVKALGERLYLDSGTLTPLLKKLEAKGLITRKRANYDERNLIVSLTPQGEALKDEALKVPAAIAEGTSMEPDEMEELYRLLYKILDQMQPARRQE